MRQIPRTTDIREIDHWRIWLRSCIELVFKTEIASFTASGSHVVYICDCTSGNIVVTLPTPTTDGRVHYIFKKIDATMNTVTISGVEGGLTLSTQYAVRYIVWSGTMWLTI